MDQSNLASFFDQDGLPPMWSIEVVFEVRYIIQGQEVQMVVQVEKDSRGEGRKQIELQLGQTMLYKRSKQLKGMCLTLSKFEPLPALLGFRLIRNRRTFQFYMNDAQTWREWRDNLARRTLLSNFHETFNVAKMIGKGSFAKVYLANKKDDPTQYAIKAFNKEFMREQFKGKESLQNEMYVMRKLEHPHIVNLHEVYETTNSIYFVIDIVSGGELLKHLKNRGPLTSQELQTMIFNLIKALDHLHSKNCIHRDLKPENILLKSKDECSSVVLADFGLATFMEGEIIFKRCGTPGFVAPEILHYKEGQPMYDAKCDMFSAGVIFYILVTGRQPFKGADHKAILRANKTCEINFDIPQIQKSSPALEDLLRKMLSPDPANRISSHDGLKHPYFQTLPSGMYYNQEKIFTYPSVPVQNSVDSQVGSMELQTRTAAMNGKTDTIGSISNYSTNSIPKIEQTQTPIPKFSQFCQKYGGSAKTLQSPKVPLDGSPKQGYGSPSGKLRKNDLHMQALRNSLHTKQKRAEDLNAKEESGAIRLIDSYVEKIESALVSPKTNQVESTNDNF